MALKTQKSLMGTQSTSDCLTHGWPQSLAMGSGGNVSMPRLTAGLHPPSMRNVTINHTQCPSSKLGYECLVVMLMCAGEVSMHSSVPMPSKALGTVS